jgi:hypothetical protein
MKTRIPAVVFLASLLTPVFGETFVGPTAATNRLVVPSNSAVIITTMLGDFTNSTQVVLDGFQFTQSYFAPLQTGNSYALAGPSELILTNPAIVTFYRLTNSTIVSQGVGNDPIGIPIDTNKTMHLFGVPAPVNASFSRPGSGFVSFVLQPNQPAEFTGPGTLFLNSGVFPPLGKFISYFIEEDGFVLPDQRAVAGPAGSLAISVEKSFDLATWSPVLLETTSDEPMAFYRLRIQH